MAIRKERGKLGHPAKTKKKVTPAFIEFFSKAFFSGFA